MRLPIYVIAILITIMLSTIISVVVLVIKGLCDTFIALADMFTALATLIFTAKRIK